MNKMYLSKETEEWFASHIKHVAACRTTHWFLKGDLKMTNTIWFALLATRKKMRENIMAKNALFTNYVPK